MSIVYAKHLPYGDGRLADVLEEMRRRGAPVIRVVRYEDHLIALEGSHRLAAAALLCLRPIFVEVQPELGEFESDIATFWHRALTELPAYDVTGSPLFDQFDFEHLHA